MAEQAYANDASRSLLERLVHHFGGEPRDRADLLQVLRSAQARDLLDADALSMIEGVFAVSDLQARDIMVPRSQMVVVENDWSPAQMLPVIIDSGHSRFPVIGEDRDEVEGVVLAKDLLHYFREANGDEFDINDILRPAVFIPESKRLNTLLKEFRSSRNHMAVVVDEYGGIAGLVTIEDVLEQIVGEIDDEHDTEEALLIRPRGRGRFSVRALTPIDEFNEYFGSGFSDEEFDTIGGLVLTAFGRVPERGETIDVDGFGFRVLVADTRRVYLLQVVPPATTPRSDA